MVADFSQLRSAFWTQVRRSSVGILAGGWRDWVIVEYKGRIWSREPPGLGGEGGIGFCELARPGFLGKEDFGLEGVVVRLAVCIKGRLCEVGWAWRLQ